jgi:hypothetical protein
VVKFKDENYIETLLILSPILFKFEEKHIDYSSPFFFIFGKYTKYGTIKRQQQICVGSFQRNIIRKLTKTYNKPYIFLDIKVQTLLFGTAFTKLALNMVPFNLIFVQSYP